MRKFLILSLTMILIVKVYSQEKQQGIYLGLNKMQPTDSNSNYEPDIGFQVGLFSQKATSKAFTIEKGIYLSRTTFTAHNSQNVLVLKNTTYSLSVPFALKWIRLKPFHPFVGLEGIWHFSSKTDYYEYIFDQKEVSGLQLAFLFGAEVPFGDQFSFDLRYSATPYLISVGPRDLNGWHFSLKYTLPNKEK